MYAQVRTYHFQPQACAEALRIVRDFIVPAIERQVGNTGVIQMIEGSSGKVILITLWETEAAMRAPFDRTHYMREQSVVIAGCSTSPPTSETYEVDVLVQTGSTRRCLRHDAAFAAGLCDLLRSSN